MQKTRIFFISDFTSLFIVKVKYWEGIHRYNITLFWFVWPSNGYVILNPRSKQHTCLQANIFNSKVATVKVKINILHIFFKNVIMIIFGFFFQFHLLLYHRVVAVVVIFYFVFWFDSCFKKKPPASELKMNQMHCKCNNLNTCKFKWVQIVSKTWKMECVYKFYQRMLLYTWN